MYTDKWADIVNEYNHTYHSTIKMKLSHVNSTTGFGLGIENNEKFLKLNVGDHVRISKYKNVFAKDYAPNWSEKVFRIKKINLTIP